MRTGEPITAAPGRTSDKVLSLGAEIVMGGIRADLKPYPRYRARNYALFNNGTWVENVMVGAPDKSVRVAVPIPPGSTTASIAFVDSGDHEQFDETNYVPGGWIKEEESADAARLRVQWVAGYRVDEDTGEGSLASVVLTGISRFSNCEPDDRFPLTRGRVWYTIEQVGTTTFVRLWARGSLVASGSRTGDGLVTLAANNSSGLTGTALLTYSADVGPNTAFVTCRYAAAYYLHYSTSALSYPRTPEMTIYDKGVANYIVITPILPGGSYNYSVQALGDDGTLESPVSAPADSPKLIKSPPLPVTSLAATGTAAAITVTWVAGEGGCTYMVYSSLPDEPVNLGQWPLPSPILRPIGASSCVLAPVTGYAPLDRTTAWQTFYQGIDDVVANMNAAYTVGTVGFVTTLDTQSARANDFLRDLSDSVGIPTPQHDEQIAMAFDNLREAAVFAQAITDIPTFQLSIYQAMSTFLCEMGIVVEGNTSRYIFDDGSLPWSGSGTSDGPEGSMEAGGGLVSGVSVKGLVTPLVTNRIVRVIVRCTRVADGLQEVNDEVLDIELDASGNVMLPRPNQSYITGISANNLTVTFSLMSKTDDQVVAASTLAVYYAAAPSSPTYVTPAGSAAVSSEVTGMVTADVPVTFPSAGYYVVASKALSAAGVQSSGAKESTIWVGTEQPAAATSVSANVIRSTPVEPVED